MILRIDNVSFSYPSNPIFVGLSLDVPTADFLCILGPNGSGKSTLLKLMSRILEPQKGSVTLDSRTLPHYSRRDLAKMIAYVPQDSTQLFPFTVLETVLMGRTPYLRPYSFEATEDVEIAREMLRRVSILDLAEKPITAISGGERQRALIARALTQRPNVLLLDEPNAHLDIAHQLEVFEILREQNERERLTVICVSHEINLASAFSSRILLLEGGNPNDSPGERQPRGVAALGGPAEVLTGELLTRIFQAPVIVDNHPTAGTPRVSLEVKK